MTTRTFHIDLDLDSADVPDIFDLSVWVDDVRAELEDAGLHGTMEIVPDAGNEYPGLTITLRGSTSDVNAAFDVIEQYADAITDAIYEEN